LATTALVTETPASVVFLSENLEVLFLPGSTDYLLITFNEAGEPANGRTLWGEKLVRRKGLTTLGFMTRTANWFPEADMRAAVAALTPLLARFPQRVLFGHSMGGYGAIKYSRLLCNSVALSFCPQYSINPNDVGSFDGRYLQSYRPALHGDMRIAPTDVAGAVYLCYDPWLREDKLNVDLIRLAAPAIKLLPMAYTGHGTITAFRGSEFATQLFALSRAQNFNAVRRYAAVRRRAHSARVRLMLRPLAQRHLPWAGLIYIHTCSAMQPDVAASFADLIAALAVQRGNSDLCRRVTQRAIEIFPNHPRLLEVVAHHLGHVGDLQSAIDIARRLTVLQPENAAARSQLASLLQRNGDLRLARIEALAALDIDPVNIVALRMLAHIDRADNNLEQAIKWLHRGVAVQPEDTGLHVWMAGMLLQTGAITAAQAAAEQVLLLQPTDAAALKILAEVAQRGGDFSTAITIVRRAMLSTPNDTHLQAWLAQLLMQSGALADAQVQAERTLAMDAANSAALRCLVEIALREKRLDDAAKWARTVAQVVRGNAAHLAWAAHMLIRAGDLDSSRDVALSVLAIEPSHADALHCLSDISARTERLEHAIIWAGRAVDAEPKKADRHHYAALLLMRGGDFAAARKSASSALALNPNHAGALRCITDINARLPETEK
jgi:tetratricopeptide (TPR) repeat protein